MERDPAKAGGARGTSQRNQQRRGICQLVRARLEHAMGRRAYHGPGRARQFAQLQKYPMISSFSCSVGHFDQPDQRCLSEDMVLAAGSGASATISATREAYADANGDLANAFYENMFDSTQIGTSFGEAYTEAKVTVFDQNAQNYSFLGDPSLCPVNCVRSCRAGHHQQGGRLDRHAQGAPGDNRPRFGQDRLRRRRDLRLRKQTRFNTAQHVQSAVHDDAKRRRHTE